MTRRDPINTGGVQSNNGLAGTDDVLQGFKGEDFQGSVKAEILVSVVRCRVESLETLSDLDVELSQIRGWDAQESTGEV